MGTAWITIAFASALGIGAGGGLAWLMKKGKNSFVLIYSLCAGIVMGLLFLEMIPESIELGGWMVLCMGIVAGVFLFKLIHIFMHNVTFITESRQKDLFIHTGILLTISIAIHNFPIGVALGNTIGTELGNVMLLSLVLHNIPEGIIIFVPLFLAGFGFFTLIFCTSFITIPVAAGAYVGQLIGMDLPYVLAFIVNLALTVIFMVALKEIFWEAVKHSSILYASSIGLIGFGLVYVSINVMN